jgi:2-polyprenyl-3-methyl-5-hydroxy-6-metoxy-1,4-benzoquinol methylase
MQTAVERWEELLDARAQQMDAAYAQLGRTSADFWDRRAKGFHRTTKATVVYDPFLHRLQQAVTPQTSVLDVGAGTGRLTIALATQAKEVIAVEPNATMLDYIRRDASEQHLSNVSYLQTTWQDAPDTLSADIVICSHVLYPIKDIVPFLTKLQAATRDACYLYMRATPVDAQTSHIWHHFHGDERRMPPSYIHALDVLYEMGIYAEVEIVETPQSLRYPSFEGAVDELIEQLILPEDERTHTELRGLLEGWLVERDGMLVPPIEKMVCAIMKIQGV